MKKATYRSLIQILLVILILFQFNSCLDPNWDLERVSDEFVITPGVAAPLLYGSLSVDELLTELDNSGFIEVDEDSLLYISFREDLFSFPASDVIDIPDQSFLEFFIETDVAISPEWLAANVGDTVTFEKNKDGVFVFENNERIDSIQVKTMDLVIDVVSTFEHTGILTITSDGVLIDGEPFQDVVQISDASGNFTYRKTIPVDGHTVILDNSNPDTTVLPLHFQLDLINSGNPVLPSQSCDITMSFVDPEFYSVFGYIGDYDLLVAEDSFEFDVLESDTINGNISFADPQLNLEISNSYGVPVDIDLSNVRAFSKSTGEYTDLIFNPGVIPFSIRAPGIDNIGDTANSVLRINKDLCNIVEVMESTPSEFSYRVSTITNPDGPEETVNFVTDSSKLDVGLEVVIPIWLRADGFSIETTEPFDFEDQIGGEADLVDYLRLTLDAANGLPADVIMQVYFKDGSYNILDSMFVSDAFLISANVDDNDEVISANEQSKSVEFTGEKIEKIENTKYLTIRAGANTARASEGKYVKFFSYYDVEFKLKMKADLTINSQDL